MSNTPRPSDYRDYEVYEDYEEYVDLDEHAEARTYGLRKAAREQRERERQADVYDANTRGADDGEAYDEPAP